MQTYSDETTLKSPLPRAHNDSIFKDNFIKTRTALHFCIILQEIDPTGEGVKGLVPQDYSPLASHESPAGYKPGISTISSSNSIICKNGSHNSGTPITYVYWFIIKNTAQESPREDMPRARDTGSRRHSKTSKPSPGVPPSQHLA